MLFACLGLRHRWSQSRLSAFGRGFRGSVGMGALIITYTILGVPYYNCSIMGPKNPILIIEAPIVGMEADVAANMSMLLVTMIIMVTVLMLTLTSVLLLVVVLVLCIQDGVADAEDD